MNRKYTIGLIESGIMEDFSKAVCLGAKRKAESEHLNFVALPGKYLNRDLSERPDIQYEYQYNMIYSLPNPGNIDALIISAGDVGCLTTEENVRRMLEQYKGIPCVLVASKLEGYTSINYDNYKGIRDGLEFLITQRNCRHICMVGGPDSNTDSFERKQHLTEILKEYGIPFEERNYVEGNLTHQSYREFAKILDNNPDMEAVFCVNDASAIGLYSEMKKRGLQPGRDVYVFGYDNTVAGTKLKPALSSVWADPIALGEKAVTKLLSMLEGGTAESEIMPTWLIKRNSFGNLSGGSAGAEYDLLNREAFLSAFNNIFYRYERECSNLDSAAMQTQFLNAMKELFRLSRQDEITEQEKDDISDEFENFFNNGMLEYADIDNLRQYFKHIYTSLKRNSGSVPFLEIFGEIYSRIIFSLDNRFGTIRSQEQENSFYMKLFVRNIMQFEKGNDQSYAVLLKNLDWLDIQNACVFMFQEPITHLDGEPFELPDYLMLKALLKNGEVQTIPAVYQVRPFNDIFKFEEMDDGQHSMVVLPLFSNELLYGLLLCDLTDKIFEECEFLIYQLNAAVKMIELLKSNEAIQQELEHNLSTLRENNIVLDHLSRLDALTGINNRRGFYEAADAFIKKSRSEGFDLVVGYVDMDNLKIINDRYGHEEGDFSLKHIGETLMSIIQEDGAVGRIGGDEFAFVTQSDGLDAEEKITAQIRDSFGSYNLGSDKPYNLTVSSGAYLLKASENLTLQEALAFADEKLYEAKQHRIRQVAKDLA